MDSYPRDVFSDRSRAVPTQPQDGLLASTVRRSGGTRVGLRMGSVAYQQIKGQLLEGRWGAGERLPLEVFMSAFGVSKQPIMEALRRLDADGLVVIVPQVGCRVAAYEPADVADYFTVFAAFEGSIAGVAASRRSDDDLQLLHEVHTRIGALCSERDSGTRSRGYLLLNREFHGAIHRMARSYLVEETSLRMWDLSDFLINTAGVPHPMGSALEERHSDHQSIYEALVAGDAVAARSSMESHVLGNVTIIRSDRPTRSDA
jgi:DNA-binding GntR family transcriptional regulator